MMKIKRLQVARVGSMARQQRWPRKWALGGWRVVGWGVVMSGEEERTGRRVEGR